jgi:hypothetical protein
MSLWLAPSLSPADRAALERWFAECRARPGGLPAGVTAVQARLIRRVGRGELPDRGPAYLKVMDFPRARDRFRYLLRPMPAEHEAAMLGAVADQVPAVAVPAVLAVGTQRRRGLPRLSVLATAGLELGAEPTCASPAEAAAVAVRLATAGIFHPDLHSGNLPVLADGRLAVLDLQSARRRRAPLRLGLRLQMASRLAREPGGLTAAVAAGLISAAEAPLAAARAQRTAAEEVDRRVRRCLTTSSEFIVLRRLGGTSHRRRDCEGPEKLALRGGRELLRAWMGDRALEVLDGRPPLFSRLVRDRLWPITRFRLYIPQATDADLVGQRWQELQEGHQRWRRLRRGQGLGISAAALPAE